MEEEETPKWFAEMYPVLHLGDRVIIHVSPECPAHDSMKAIKGLEFYAALNGKEGHVVPPTAGQISTEIYKEKSHTIAVRLTYPVVIQYADSTAEYRGGLFTYTELDLVARKADEINWDQDTYMSLWDQHISVGRGVVEDSTGTGDSSEVPEPRVQPPLGDDDYEDLPSRFQRRQT